MDAPASVTSAKHPLPFPSFPLISFIPFLYPPLFPLSSSPPHQTPRDTHEARHRMSLTCAPVARDAVPHSYHHASTPTAPTPNARQRLQNVAAALGDVNASSLIVCLINLIQIQTQASQIDQDVAFCINRVDATTTCQRFEQMTLGVIVIFIYPMRRA